MCFYVYYFVYLGDGCGKVGNVFIIDLGSLFGGFDFVFYSYMMSLFKLIYFKFLVFIYVEMGLEKFIL